MLYLNNIYTFMKIITAITLIILSIFINNVYSQCSDAGVCIVGERHNTDEKSYNTSSLSLQYSLGFSGTPEDITYHALKLGSDIVITKEFSLGIVVPFYAQVYKTANTFSNGGIGDAFVIGNYSIQTGKKQNLLLQGGFKINTSSINKYEFTYTNAQGTNDLILGGVYSISLFNFSGGIQVPLTNYKDDDFEFKRGADLMLKGGIKHNIDKFALSFDVLGIKRLSKSEVTSSDFFTATSVTTTIDKSDFLQINLIGGAAYNISTDLVLDLNIAVPVIKREEDSDGTKRVFSANLGVRFNL